MNVQEIKTAFEFAKITFRNGRAGLSDIHVDFLLKEVERLEKRIGRIDDIVRDKDYSDTETFALILEVTENKWVEYED